MSRELPRAARTRLILCSLPVATCLAFVRPAVAAEAPRADDVADEREVSLPELLAYADRHAPTVLIATRRRGYADAARAEANPLLRDNPTFEFGIGPRFDGALDRDFDFVAALGQPVEIAGQRGLRLEAAARMQDRLEAETSATRWALRRDVTLAYRAAVIAREQVLIADRLVGFAEEMLGIARRRLAAGDGTVIDVRVAETDLAQARQARLAAEQELRTLRLRIAEITGWSIERPPNVRTGLTPPRPVPTLAAVLERASDRHPELRARQAAVSEAQARVELSDRESWPNPTFGVQVAREGSAGSPANYIVLGQVGLPLPFWRLNQGERAERRVEQDLAQAEARAAARAVRADIARAHAALVAAAERLALFQTGVAPQLEDSLGLLRRGFEAGELPLLDLAVARERFLSAQRDALAAYADYDRALAELEFAVGAEIPAASIPGGAP